MKEPFNLDELLKQPSRWDNFIWWLRWTVLLWFKYIFTLRVKCCYECGVRLTFKQYQHVGMCNNCNNDYINSYPGY